MSRFRKILLAAALCFRGFAARAENAASEGVYTPKALTQSTPMRVEVIDGVTFRDIETGLVFRLFRRRRVSARSDRQSWTPALAVRRRRGRLAHDRDPE